MGKRSFYSVTFLAIIVSACSAAGAELRKEQGRTLSQSLFETDFFIVSMSKLPTGHHLVNATLNGTNGDFILDTGASQTVLSERYIKRFGVDKSDYLRTEEGAGAGGSIERQAPATSQAPIAAATQAVAGEVRTSLRLKILADPRCSRR